jgi:hypothetical protein
MQVGRLALESCAALGDRAGVLNVLSEPLHANALDMLRHVRTTPWTVLLSYAGCDMHFLKDHVALGILKDHEADLPVTSLWECSLCR